MLESTVMTSASPGVDWVELLAAQVDAELTQQRQESGRSVSIMQRDGMTVRTHTNVETLRDTMVVPCRCWRCRGGVAHSDKAALDRLLGAHLARQTLGDREAFIWGWRSNPKHPLDGLRQIEAWIRIAQGESEPEPIYVVAE